MALLPDQATTADEIASKAVSVILAQLLDEEPHTRIQLPNIHIMLYRIECIKLGMTCVQNNALIPHNVKCPARTIKIKKPNSKTHELFEFYQVQNQVFEVICAGKCTVEQINELRNKISQITPDIEMLEERIKKLNILNHKMYQDYEAWRDDMRMHPCRVKSFSNMDVAELEAEKLYHSFVMEMIKKKRFFDLEMKFLLIKVNHLVKVCYCMYLLQLNRFLNNESE